MQSSTSSLVRLGEAYVTCERFCFITEVEPEFPWEEGVGEGLGDAVGVELEVGLALGLGEFVFGVGDWETDGFGSGAVFFIWVPLSQTNFLPDLIQVNFLPPKFLVNPIFEQLAPGFRLGAAIEGVNEKRSVRETRSALTLTDAIISAG